MNDTPKAPTKKPKRVSARKELAVVTLAAVASIAGVGGLVSMHQPVSQAAQPAPHVAQAPKPSQTSWSPSPQGHHSTVSQGSKAVVRTGQSGSATQQSAQVSRTFGRVAEGGDDS